MWRNMEFVNSTHQQNVESKKQGLNKNYDPECE